MKSLTSLANHPQLLEVPQVTRIVVAAGPQLVCDAFTARFGTEVGFHSISAPGGVQVAAVNAGTFAPHVVVIDTSTSKESEEAHVQEMMSLPTKPAVVALVANEDIASAVRLVNAGAIGTVLKNAPSSELVGAVRWAATGTAWISPPLLRGVLASIQTTQFGGRGEKLRSLTSREMEILQFVVDGLGRREISDKLYLSIETVRTHMCSIMNKLGVHSAIAAAALGRDAGLLPKRHLVHRAAS